MIFYIAFFIALMAAWGVFMVRNEWVCKARLSVLNADFLTYQTMPEYGVMMRYFWIWDASRFLYWNEPQEVTEAIRRAELAMRGRAIIARATTSETAS